ncbi:hypothetical protein [Synechococcus sp. MVIR-18-1]|uniref:hypothetical protein n=1 Tax=Synechococcus sp. MVIR-18-1 TaxID=1386941 RepID=UPI001646BE75|nr:hypothetical protein [Synechococcus sp. MVIR-18-1]QNI75258.1 hypothetical protein SynMVIR181_00244 [Synechococcus sp. MVIR-18-1]
MNNDSAEGKADLKWDPCAETRGLKEPGSLSALSLQASHVDEAFGEAMDQQVAQLFNL